MNVKIIFPNTIGSAIDKTIEIPKATKKYFKYFIIHPITDFPS